MSGVVFTAVLEKDENVWFFFDVDSVVTKLGIIFVLTSPYPAEVPLYPAPQ